MDELEEDNSIFLHEEPLYYVINFLIPKNANEESLIGKTNSRKNPLEDLKEELCIDFRVGVIKDNGRLRKFLQVSKNVVKHLKVPLPWTS